MANTLYEYYQSLGQPLPSWQDRAKIYEQQGLGPASSYTGLENQNVDLLNKLQTNPIQSPIVPQPIPQSIQSSPSTSQGNVVPGDTRVNPQTGQVETYTQQGWLPTIGNQNKPLNQMDVPSLREPALGTVARQAGEAGQKYPEEYYQSQNPIDYQKLIDDAYQKYGITDLVSKLSQRPEKTFEQIYQDAYANSGLGDLKIKIGQVTDQLGKLDASFTQAVGNINDDPFLSEGIRSGRVSKANEQYERKRANVINQLTVLQNQFERGRDDAQGFAKEVLGQFYQGRQIDENALNIALKRAESDVQAGIQTKEEERKRQEYQYYPQFIAGYGTPEKNLESDIKEFTQAKRLGYIPKDMMYQDFLKLKGTRQPSESLDILRRLQIQGLTSSSSGQIVNAKTGFPIKLTNEQSSKIADYQNVLSRVDLVRDLLDQVQQTGAIKGWVLKEGIYRPVIQRELNPKEVELMQEFARISNQYIYLVSGKQINEQEYVRLSKTIPNIQGTKEQNQTVIDNFRSYLEGGLGKYLRVNGWKIQGSDQPNQPNQKNESYIKSLGL